MTRTIPQFQTLAQVADHIIRTVPAQPVRRQCGACYSFGVDADGHCRRCEKPGWWSK